MLSAGAEVTVGVRPEHLIGADADAVNSWTAQVALVEYLGDHRLLHMVAGDGLRLVAKRPENQASPAGSMVRLRVSPNDILLFDTNGCALTRLGDEVPP